MKNQRGRRGHHISYDKAKKILRELKITSSWEFKKLKVQHKLPGFIPSQPERTYKNKGWKGSGDFFGTNRKGDWQDRKNYKTYKEAKKWARASPINSLIEYRYAKLPRDMPRNPWAFYKDEWEGGKEWINPKSKYLSWIEAKEIVKQYEIHSPAQYFKNLKMRKKHNLPNSPHKSYKEWQGWIDFLPKKFVLYEEAKKFVNENNIPNHKTYIEIAQKGYLPDCLPRAPSVHYKEWKGSEDFFNWIPPFMNYKKAQKLVQKLGITTSTQYEILATQNKLPKGLPKSPISVYRKMNPRWVK